MQKWGKQLKLAKNTSMNESPSEEEAVYPTEEEMVFPPTVNEPESPVYLPAFSPLEESEEEGFNEAITDHHSYDNGGKNAGKYTGLSGEFLEM